MLSKLVLGMAVGLAVVLFQALPDLAFAASQAALTGTVTSVAEGAMEGVVVSAKRKGAAVTVSVTSNQKGQFSFPADRLEPGQYALTIRAVGYDLSAPTTADIAADKTTTADLKLNKTKNLAGQLTNSEWAMSVPGNEEQKSFLLNCTGCHTVERIVRSTHDVDEWMQVITRMRGYAATTIPIKPQRIPDQSRAGTPEQNRRAAEWLATINLSQVEKWEFPLQTMPRPSGRATQAIVTEYDLPRPTIQPHDVIVDADGVVWYSDFGGLFISKFDPKTLKLTEFPTKQFKPDAPIGNLSLEQDKQGTIWFDTMYQGALGTIEPKTGEIKYYPLPPEWNDFRVQLNFVGLRHDVDGKVWTKDAATQYVYRLDLASGKWERFHPTDLLSASGERFGLYQALSDSQNNLWMAEFGEGYIGKIDAKTLKITWFTPPTPHSRTRRMQIDDQDRILVTEFRANKVALFDTKTEKFTEYLLPTPFTQPYRAAMAKNGEIWTSGMASDRAVRFDPKTGTAVEYLLPRGTNSRSLFVDNSTTPATFWTGNNHGASLIKVEALD